MIYLDYRSIYIFMMKMLRISLQVQLLTLRIHRANTPGMIPNRHTIIGKKGKESGAKNAIHVREVTEAYKTVRQIFSLTAHNWQK